MTRASKERKRAAERITMITRVIEQTQNGAMSIQAAAVHEAAHVIATFHWNVPIGNRGVYITPHPTGNDAAGYVDVLWSDTLAKLSSSSTAEYNAAVYSAWVGSVMAPFAEYRYREAAAANLDWISLLRSCYMDFADMLGQHAPPDVAMSYGWMCFRLWMGGELQPGDLPGELDGVTRDLVSDTDAMLSAYWKQIAAFANALLGSDGLQMTSGEVEQWRDAHFQKCDVALSARGTR